MATTLPREKRGLIKRFLRSIFLTLRKRGEFTKMMTCSVSILCFNGDVVQDATRLRTGG